jgi:hypothetical protein
VGRFSPDIDVLNDILGPCLTGVDDVSLPPCLLAFNGWVRDFCCHGIGEDWIDSLTRGREGLYGFGPAGSVVLSYSST